jgi:hypothetical protein
VRGASGSWSASIVTLAGESDGINNTALTVRCQVLSDAEEIGVGLTWVRRRQQIERKRAETGIQEYRTMKPNIADPADGSIPSSQGGSG